jgi:hypothetical protein
MILNSVDSQLVVAVLSFEGLGTNCLRICDCNRATLADWIVLWIVGALNAALCSVCARA